MSSHLDGLIDRFLEDHRESDCGGWAQITPGDIELLREIIRELITLKCDKDADGDYPIQFKLVNRRTHEHMHYSPLPYREQRNDDREVVEVIPFVKLMRILMMNLSIAQSRLDTAFRIEEHYVIEAELAEEKRKKQLDSLGDG